MNPIEISSNIIPVRPFSTHFKMQMSFAEWLETGETLFGPNKRQWQFICPDCWHIAKTEDWYDYGKTQCRHLHSHVANCHNAAVDCLACGWIGSDPFTSRNPIRIINMLGQYFYCFDFYRGQ